MDVSGLKPMDRANVVIAASGGAASAEAVMQPAEISTETNKAEVDKTVAKREYKTKTDFTNDELLPITQQLNKFMTYLNADIQFSLHEKTQRLIVRVVDVKENKVLREFPPEEFLDTIANIREYVGVLLDKKA